MKWVLVVLAALMLMAIVGPAPAWADDPPTQVSGNSPFDGSCGTEDQSGKVFINSEVEPWIDVNPEDSDNMVGAWQQDRWSDGGARGLVAGVSQDGGETWQVVPIPGLSQCTDGDYERATDPWVSFGPNGDLYQISLSFNTTDTDHAVLASKSTDGGLTWSDPVVLRQDTKATVFNDKESITADPYKDGYVYAIWDRLVFPTEQARGRAPERAIGYRGPTWFTRSTDGGESWEEARKIYDPGEVNQTIGNQIVVLPDGNLVNAFDLIYNFKNAHKVRGLNVAVLISDDQGENWSQAIIVDKLRTIGVTDPETGDEVRTGDIIPDIAVDPNKGNLYLVWQDSRFSGFDEIAFSMSTDGGHTWSSPVKVSKGNVQSFTASVSVNSVGTVAVTYYDFRNDGPDDGKLLTDYYIITCGSNCTDSGSWSETRLTEKSFDMRQAPQTDSGFFTGDYEGLAAAGSNFLPFFSQSHGGDPASIFFTEVEPKQ